MKKLTAFALSGLLLMSSFIILFSSTVSAINYGEMVFDDFSDGNLNNNPVWANGGGAKLPTVVSNQLRINGSVNDPDAYCAVNTMNLGFNDFPQVSFDFTLYNLGRNGVTGQYQTVFWTCKSNTGANGPLLLIMNNPATDKYELYGWNYIGSDNGKYLIYGDLQLMHQYSIFVNVTDGEHFNIWIDGVKYGNLHHQYVNGYDYRGLSFGDGWGDAIIDYDYRIDNIIMTVGRPSPGDVTLLTGAFNTISCPINENDIASGDWIYINNNSNVRNLLINVDIYYPNGSLMLQSQFDGDVAGGWIWYDAMEIVRANTNDSLFGEYLFSFLGNSGVYGFSNCLNLTINVTSESSGGYPSLINGELLPKTSYLNGNVVISGFWTWVLNRTRMQPYQDMVITVTLSSSITTQGVISDVGGTWYFGQIMDLVRRDFNSTGIYLIQIYGIDPNDDITNTLSFNLTVMSDSITPSYTSGVISIIWLMISLLPAIILSTKFEKYGYVIGLLLMTTILGFSQPGYMFITIISYIGAISVFFKGD